MNEKYVVTNAYLFEDKKGVKRLFAEVIEDPRWETGHHIVTSKVISVDTRSGRVVTESNSEYEVRKFFTKDEFVSHLRDTFDDERVKYYLFYTNIIE